MVRQSKFFMFSFVVFLLLLIPLSLAAASGGISNTTKGIFYGTIQEAVDGADEGDIIELAAGTYEEAIVIDKPLTLRSAAGAVIDGGTDDCAVSVESPGVTLKGLTITGAVEASIVVDFDADGFSGPAHPKCFSVLGCTLEGDNSTKYAVMLLGTIDHAEIIMRDNTVRNFTTYGLKSDRADEYIDSKVTIENNIFENAGYYGIDLDTSVSSTEILVAGNNVTAEYDAIYLGGILDGSSVTIRGNTLRSDDEAIYFGDDIDGSTLVIEGNEITSDDDEEAIDFSEVIIGSRVTIKGNTLRSSYRAIRFCDIDGSTLVIEGNEITSADAGIYFSYPINGSATEIVIAGNLFRENKTGIYLAAGDWSRLTIAFNAFIDNDEDIFFEDESTAINARLNWWGAAASPTGLAEPVAFTPWLAALSVVPGQTSAVKGESCTITASLLDSEGALAETSLLAVRFTVAGAHNLSEIVPMVNGVATLQYIGNPAGIDTITAEVLFASEAVSLNGAAELAWEEKPVLQPETAEPVKPLPPTAGSTDSLPWFGVIFVLTAVAALLYSRRPAATR